MKTFGLLFWALIFFVVAVAAGIFGFSGLADSSADFSKIIFFFAIVALIVTAIARAARRL